MARSVSLSAYLSLSRSRIGQARPAVGPSDRQVARPEGEVIWAHATSETRAAALIQITTRLRAQRPDLHLLLTLAPDLALPQQPKSFVIPVAPPDENLDLARAFLDRWRPDLCLWTGGQLRHALLDATAERQVPMFLIDADESGLDASRWRWLPDLSKVTLRHFDRILASTGNSANRLLKLGVPAGAITITGPLMEGCAALPCNEKARDR
ncbi:MAG TPA: glycosyltransferase N-terminal domain-containing protein, partial [Paracoccaceae bacterium]|nr:glycosyltransferase N-terminal domain-containing protein [Paracoccaceae bacterium]